MTDRDRVAEWARRAGDEATTALSPEEAIRWYTTALEAIDANDPPRVDVLIALGGAQRWADSDAFRQTLLDAAALAERMGDDDGLVRAALRNNRGGAAGAGAVDTERVAVLERALEVVGPDDSPDRARLLATLAIELSQGAEWERRLALADEAVAVPVDSATRSPCSACCSTRPRRLDSPRRSISGSSTPRRCSTSRSGSATPCCSASPRSARCG